MSGRIEEMQPSAGRYTSRRISMVLIATDQIAPERLLVGHGPVSRDVAIGVPYRDLATLAT